MLGVLRSRVTRVAAMPLQANIIQYVRGKTTTLASEALDEVSCVSHNVVKQVYKREFENRSC